MKLLFPTPVVYDGNDARYLQRDGARFARECIAEGHVGIKIVLDDGSNIGQPASPLLMKVAYRDWCDADFWRRQCADAVLLYGGYGRRMSPVARAIRKAGVPLALKMDDAIGLVRFPRNAAVYFWRHYWKMRQRHSPARALAESLLRFAIWPIRSRKAYLTSYLELFDVILGESRLCVGNTRDFLRWAKRLDIAKRLAIMPHPVLNEFSFGPNDAPKQDIVLAVAMNWHDPLKRGRLLGKSLGRFLQSHPEWTAKVIGNGAELVAREAGGLAYHIKTLPTCPSVELLPHYRQAKILTMPSGAESFPIVVTEALCCGCSVVFPPELPALAELVAADSATQAAFSSSRGFADALESEANAWENHLRDPTAIASSYGRQCHVDSSLKRLMKLLSTRRQD